MKYKQSNCQFITIGHMLELKLMKKDKRNHGIWFSVDHAIDFDRKDELRPFVTGSQISKNTIIKS